MYSRRNSDDPLISGATNDNQNEFCPIASTPMSEAATSPPIGRKKTSRARKKGQFKLRFHHQALPPEYLDHYEATQNNLQIINQKKEKTQKINLKQSNSNQITELPDDRTNETVRNWLQKISEINSDGVPLIRIKEEPGLEASTSTAIVTPVISAPLPVVKKPSRVINYSDLPYMGEMTLENSKPRRGRKPKKADICHLIYKNYGTIFPGTPKDLMHNGGIEPKSSAIENDPKKSILQNKIISSLLEKRLTQESKRLSPSITETSKNTTNKKSISQFEPLNLCLRDVSACDSLTVSSADEEDDSSILESNRTTPIISPTDLTTDTLLAANLKMALPNFQNALLDKPPQTPDTPSTIDSCGTPSPGSQLVFWPPAGIFIHPSMALYYQKMIDASGDKTNNPSNSTTPAVSVSPAPLTTGKESQLKMLVPKDISQLIKQEKPPPSTVTSRSSETSSTSSKAAPQKRKRSAIFIPPMPSENTNAATEVSICKFKFTGGAKPSLQEKKMLSVDSGGNFRYYSGTGDKSMRGYEFFPRESLQQSSLVTGSSAGAFLNTPGEKISKDLPSLGLSNDVLQLPEFLANPVNSLAGPSILNQPPVRSNSVDRKKRKSRRSIQREKLEKTFKEKGFLIQTQQLENQQGATYCKFRQLRKFTRYLFRSWKDYLPGELQQGNPANQIAGPSNDVLEPTSTVGN